MKTLTLPLLVGFAFAGLFEAPRAIAAPGDLYVVDGSTGVIFRFTPDGTKSTFASGLDQPAGLAFDRTGNLFVAENGTGSILKFTLGGTKSTFASGLASPAGLAFDSSGSLFVTDVICGSDIGCGVIYKFDGSGTKSTFATDTYDLVYLAFDFAGDLFATIQASSSIKGVLAFDHTGTGTVASEEGGPGITFNLDPFLVSGDSIVIIGCFAVGPVPCEAPDIFFATGLNDPFGLAFDAAGNLFETNRGSGSIFKFTPEGSRSTFASGLTQPTYLAFEPVTEKLRNISARGFVGTGDDVLIGGFIVGGNGLPTNAVIVRAVGPSLGQAGVSNPLSDPTLELHNSSGAIIASNDDWEDTQEDQIAATGLAPTDPNESAVYATLAAGNYTAVVRGANGATGTALIEVYSAQ